MTIQHVPKISVCIPTFNRCQYLSQAIKSVLNQTYRNFELIVIDNASSDNTQKIVKSYQNNDDRIIYIRNKTNIGVVGNMNKCLEAARGEYIKILCDDDLLYPDALEKQICVLENNNKVILCSCSFDSFNENGEKKEINLMHESKYLSWEEVIKICIDNASDRIGNPSTVLMRRGNSNKIKGFNMNFKASWDWEYYVRLLIEDDNSVMYYTTDKLVAYRVHDMSLTDLTGRLNVCNEDRIIFLYIINYSKYKNHINFKDRIISYFKFIRKRFVCKRTLKEMFKGNLRSLIINMLYFTVFNFCFFDLKSEVKKYMD